MDEKIEKPLFMLRGLSLQKSFKGVWLTNNYSKCYTRLTYFEKKNCKNVKHNWEQIAWIRIKSEKRSGMTWMSPL